MTQKIPEPPVRLDMPFSEALERLIQTDPKEVRDSMKRWKKARDKAIDEAPNVRKLTRRRNAIYGK